MALVPDQKFSTFQNGGTPTTGDIIVGLRGGINTRFNWVLPPSIETITGTANQVLVNGSSGVPVTGDITLTLPQDIAPISSPTFVGLTLSDYINGTPGIKDSNGNIILTFTPTVNAVNYFNISNDVVSGRPILKSAGADSDINFEIRPKGTGQLVLYAGLGTSGVMTIASGTTYQHQTILSMPDTAATRSILFPDASGTLALVESGQALTKVNDTNVTLTLGGTPSTALLQAVSMTLGWTGTLSPGRGGTGVNNGVNTLTLAGTLATAGAFASTFTMTGATNVTFPTSGTLATTSQLATPAALTKTDDTNVTLTLGGTPATSLLQATSLTLGWTGQLAVSRGGTGISAFGTGVATALGINVGSAGAFVTFNGALGTPSSGTATNLTGLPIAGITGLGTGIGTALATNLNGTGAISATTSPTFVTPILGAATATSINFGGSSLSNYIDSGTFTPTITFGGGSTGLTYTLQSGQYNRIGGVVFINIVIQINAVGSSTGAALVNGLPIVARVGQTQFLTLVGSAVTFTGQLASGITSGSGSVIPTTIVSASGNVQLTNAAFTSGSIIWISGSYLV